MMTRIAVEIVALLTMMVFGTTTTGAQDMSPPDMFGGPQAGQEAPSFRLKTLEGETVELAQYAGQPVVVEFGSYTCPIFRQRHPGMEALYAKYRDRVAFVTIYTIEAHPQTDPSPYAGREWVTEENQSRGILYRQPTTEIARRALAQRAQVDLAIRLPVALDDMTNATWRAYGAAPNAAYLIGADGQVKLRQGWFEPGQFERALQRELKARD